MEDLTKFISTISAIINACEDYKRLDAMNDRETMQAESISYNSIKDELTTFKNKIGG